MSTIRVARQRLKEGRFKEAAAIAGSLLEACPDDPSAWHLTAEAVLGMGDRIAAFSNLRSISESAARRGRPILALGIIKQLESLGQDADAPLDKLAALYGCTSERIADTLPEPPPFHPDITPPWEADDPNLLERAKGAMAAAWGHFLTVELPESPLPSVPILSSLPAEDLKAFVKIMNFYEVDARSTIIEQDSKGDAVYIIVEGEVEVRRRHPNRTETRLAVLGPGAFFGEMALVSRAERAASVVATQHTILLKADKAEIDRLAETVPNLGEVLVAFCHQRMLQNLMRISKVLSPVPPEERPAVISAFTSDYKKAGTRIIRQGSPGPGLFLIISGKAAVQRRDGDEILVPAMLGPGDVFGEISLLMNKPSTADVTAVENTALLFLSAEDFMTLTRDYPQLLKGAFDIAMEREQENTTILAGPAESADDLILI